MSNDAEFANGPWSAGYNGAWYEIKDVNGEWISDTCASSCHGDLKLGEHNANLIAAAPEMYELLSIISEMNSYEVSLFIENSDEIIKILAKARGES